MNEFIAFSVIIIILLLAYWSLVIAPKQRDFKKHNNYVLSLKPGDEVITFGGIIGTLVHIDKDTGVSYVKIADGVEVRMLSASLSRPYVPEDVEQAAKLGVESNTP